MALYHILAESELSQAQKDGIPPKQGEEDHRNSEEHGVFLFNSYDDLKYALENHLAESFPMDEKLVVLKIEKLFLDMSHLHKSDGVFDRFYSDTVPANAFEVDWYEPPVGETQSMKP